MGESDLDILRLENDALRRALTESKSDVALLNSVLEATPTFIIRCGRDLKIEFTNKVQDGYRMQDVLGISVMEFVPSDYQDVAKLAFAKALGGETAQYPSSNAADGSLYESYVSPTLEEGQVTGLCIVSLDVTADQLRKKALRASDDLLRIAINATGIGLWTSDPQNGVTWDARMQEITGHATPLNSQEWTERLVHPDDREAVDKAITLGGAGVRGRRPSNPTPRRRDSMGASSGQRHHRWPTRSSNTR